MYGAIEAGGTKFVCAVGDGTLSVADSVSFPTETPEITLPQVIRFFEKYKDRLNGIGVGSFGPIDIHEDSPTYGFITSTPKKNWENFDFIGVLKEEFDVPFFWTTDVNAACYGEYVIGHGKGLRNLVYYTVGTGVGGGAIQNGSFVEGFSHPEMGHMLLQRHEADNFNGTCPFHNGCLEGLASGPAIEKRTGKKGYEVSQTDVAWEIEADYLAQCAHNTTLILSPDRIIFGGGVMKQAHLLPKIREAFEKKLNQYVRTPDIETYIVTPKLGDNAGIIGCLALARDQKL